jgi:hypothetical protein
MLSMFALILIFSRFLYISIRNPIASFHALYNMYRITNSFLDRAIGIPAHYHYTAAQNPRNYSLSRQFDFP